MEDAPCNVTFKIDECQSMEIKHSKNKDDADYVVVGCIRWIRNVTIRSIANNPVTRNLSEEMLMDTTADMSLTAWCSHINKIKENC